MPSSIFKSIETRIAIICKSNRLQQKKKRVDETKIKIIDDWLSATNSVFILRLVEVDVKYRQVTF